MLKFRHSNRKARIMKEDSRILEPILGLEKRGWARGRCRGKIAGQLIEMEGRSRWKAACRIVLTLSYRAFAASLHRLIGF